MNVVQVLWGTGNYASFVKSTRAPSMASFYQGILNSPYADWLSEYSTPTQTIGRGSFTSQITITPSTRATTIDDDVIARELASQVAAGKLPAPTTDAAGNPQTYYAVFFPGGDVLKRGGGTSCTADGFCAYHSSVQSTRGKLYYGVHPDMQQGSGCDSVCGSAPGPLGMQTAVASRAMVGAITDPEIPTGWFGFTGGEVGDHCSTRTEVTGADRIAYTVQSAYSSARGTCVTSPEGVPSQTGDFTLALGAPSATVLQGARTSTLVSTSFAWGVALPVALSVTAPPGVTATTLVPSVYAGGATTLVVSAASTTAPGKYSISVAGTEGANVHTASFALNVLADVQLGVASSSLSLRSPGATSTTVTVSGGTDPVKLSVSGLPAGVSGSLSSTSVAPGSTATLTLSASSRATFGPATVTVTGTTATGITRTATIALDVNGNSFNMSVSPASLTVIAGQDASVTISTAVATGTPETIGFTLSNLAPIFGSGTFAPSTVSTGDSTTLTFHMKPSALVGTTKYYVTAYGPSGPARMVNVAVTVVNNDFSFGAPVPASITLKPGDSSRVSVSTALAYGSKQTIALTAEGVPQGVVATITPQSIKTGDSFTVTFSVPASAKVIPNPWNVSIMGTGQTARHSVGLIVATVAKTTAK